MAGLNDGQKALCATIVEPNIRRFVQILTVPLTQNMVSGFSGIMEAMLIVKEESTTLQVVKWTQNTEELVKLLKMCINLFLVNTFDEPMRLSILNASAEMQQGLSTDAIEVLSRLYECIFHASSIASGSSFSFYSALVDSNSDDSIPIQIHLKKVDESCKWPVPRKELLVLLKKSIIGAKKTLSLAESKHVVNNTAPFTSFALTAGNSLEELMRCLMEALLNNLSASEQPYGFDALKAVVDVIPFRRLDVSVVQDVMSFLVTCIENKNGAAVCLKRENVVPVSSSLFEKLTEAEDEPLFITTESRDIRRILAEVCVSSISYWWICSGLGIECVFKLNGQVTADLLALTNLVKFHFSIVKDLAMCTLGRVTNMLSIVNLIRNRKLAIDYRSRERTPYEQSLQTIKTAVNFVEQFTLAVSNNVSELGDEYVDHFLKAWFRFFKMTNYVRDEDNVIVAGVLDCFTAVEADLFNKMVETDHMVPRFLSCVLSYTDCKFMVLAKAGRCISMLLRIPSVIQDYPHFVIDALESIEKNIQYKDPPVRSALAWGVGNLADSLQAYSVEVIPLDSGFDFVKRLFELAVIISKDHFGIRYNAHRTLGMMFKWMPKSEFEHPELGNIIQTGIGIITKQIGNGNDVKARWNAAHALKMVLKNLDLVNKFEDLIMEPLLLSLLKGASKSFNYKERMLCLQGIGFITQRHLFGAHFHFTWERLFEAGVLNAEARGDDLTEVMENMVFQIERLVCYCMLKLMTLMTIEDVPKLDSTFTKNSDSLLTNVKFSLECQTEREPLICAAFENVSRICALVEPNYKITLEMILEAFGHMEEMLERNKIPPETDNQD